MNATLTTSAPTCAGCGITPDPTETTMLVGDGIRICLDCYPWEEFLHLVEHAGPVASTGGPEFPAGWEPPF